MWPSNKKIRVMVVDDSILARTMISNGLNASPHIEVVATSFNAKDARAKVDQVKPDVMTLDVEMPGMNGIDFLKQLLPVVPLPVILVSSLDLRVFNALSAGAVDFVRKPEPGKNEEFIRGLTQKVIAAAGAQVRPRPGIPTPAAPKAAPAGTAGGVRLPITGNKPRPAPPPSAGQPALSGQRNHRPGGLHRRHRGHSGGDEAAACRHPRDAHCPAHAHRLYPDVRRPAQPPVPHGGA